MGVPDLPLTGEEHEDVAGAFGPQLGDRVADGLHLVAVGVGVGIVGVHDGPVAHLDRVGASGDLHDRCVVEVPREPLRVDGGRGDDHLEVGSARQDAFEVAEQEVDVETALVRLVDDDRVVLA